MLIESAVELAIAANAESDKTMVLAGAEGGEIARRE